MTVAKMKKVQIVGHKRHLDAISRQIIESACLEPVDYRRFITEELGDLEALRPLLEDNPYTRVVSELEELLKVIGLKFADHELPNCRDMRQDFDLETVKAEVGEIGRKARRLVRFREKLTKEEARLKDIVHHIWLMRSMDIDLADLRKLEHISLIFGRVGVNDYDRLIKNITDFPILILEVTREEGNVWFFSFTKKENEEQAWNLLKSVYMERLELPQRVGGYPCEILTRAKHRLERIQIGYEELDLEIKKFRHTYGDKLVFFYRQLSILSRMKEFHNKYGAGTVYTFLLSGWVPADQEQRLLDILSNNYPDVIYLSEEAGRHEEEQPPTLLQNHPWAKPFEALVKLYGIPSYTELDPSVFVAVTYLLMFGIMFGDVGQGLVFALSGYLIATGRIPILDEKSGLILTYLGISSTTFGFLYGSLFGNEEILPALWIRPMHNIMFFLGLTVGLGVLLMLSSMVLNLINSLRNRDLHAGIFSRNGLSGIFFYLFALGSMVYLVVAGQLLFNLWVTIALLVLPLVGITFGEILVNMIEGKEEIFPEDPGSYFLEALFELFDVLISYLSNTVSFVRIGAFALNHVGLFMAVFLLAEMTRNAPGGPFLSALVIIGGNIMIIGLEGLVVGIQILRLEYFELFGKFFRGDGHEFNPIK